MLIDWFTVGAQALNFLVLVWLMRRFLYKPVLQAIDGREKRIAAQIADAEAKKTEAQAERDEFQSKNDAFDKERDELMAKVSGEADTLRKQLHEETTKEADTLRKKWRESLADQQQTLKGTLARRTREEVFAISRKTLADLADASLEESITKVLIRRLNELSPEEKGTLKSAFETAESPLVRSAFELQPQERSAIQNALNVAFSADIPLRFETAPDLIGGIELTTNGQKIAWSISEYLTSLEESVDELLKPASKAVA
jgi:F-type H+-transporting ATPase subunit b